MSTIIRDGSKMWIAALNNLRAQEQAAAELMFKFEAYALSIGCIRGVGVMHDEITVYTEEQSRALDVWWNENTG